MPRGRLRAAPGMETRMTRQAAALALFLLLSVATARADGPAGVTDADRHAIERVITTQIDAFRRDDGDAAFGFASPSIREMFGDTTRFMAMVRRGYPMVYRPRSFVFDGLADTDGRIVQRVEIVGPDGAPALALYTMEREPDGSWKIGGCQIAEPEHVGA